MVVALLALIVALGGTSYAAIKLPKNSVGNKQLKKNAVTGSKVKDGSLFSNDFAAGQLPRGPKGDPGSQGAQGPAGANGEPSSAYYASTRANVVITGLDTDNNFVTLTGLPPGSYVINGHVTAARTDAGFSAVRCGIKAAGQDSAGTPHGFGQALAVGNVTGATQFGSVVTSLAVTSGATFTATLYCWQTNNPGAHLEEGRLEAIKVGALSVQ
jgi:hypothetical protein